MVVSLVIYQQVQILTSQSIFQNVLKSKVYETFSIFLWLNGLDIPHKIASVGIGLCLDVVWPVQAADNTSA